MAGAPVDASLAAALLGLAPSALGFVVWAYAVARLPLVVATAALYAVPVVALAISHVWIGETPHPVELLGGAVAIAGVMLVNRAARARSGGLRPTLGELADKARRGQSVRRDHVDELL